MTEPKHSPLPFKYTEDSLDENDENPMEWWILDANGQVVAEILSGPDDGKRLVHRVNQGPKVDALLEIADHMAGILLHLEYEFSLDRVSQGVQKAREFLKAKQDL